ncbi:hypothetical protein PBS_36520 [Paraburkholderia sp. 2C]
MRAQPRRPRKAFALETDYAAKRGRHHEACDKFKIPWHIHPLFLFVKQDAVRAGPERRTIAGYSLAFPCRLRAGCAPPKSGTPYFNLQFAT